MLQPKTLNKTNTTTNTTLAVCLASLLEAAPAFHRLHLKVKGTGSYAAHMALNDLYDALPDLVDTIVEGYQGASETLLILPSVSQLDFDSVENALISIRKFISMITEVQGTLLYSEIINDFDSIKSTLNKAKYKLIFLH